MRTITGRNAAASWTHLSWMHLLSIAMLIALLPIACNRQHGAAPVAQKAAPVAHASVAPTTQPAKLDYTHLVTVQTALLRRGGGSGAEVIYDTIAAGARVRELERSAGYARVVTDDGREGLVAINRLKPLPAANPRQNPPNVSAAKPWLALDLQPGAAPLNAQWNTPSAACPEPVEIDDAEPRAVAYLLSQQNADGVWDPPAPQGAPANMGRTALTLEAISSTGRTMRRPRFAKAIILLHDNSALEAVSASRRISILQLAQRWKDAFDKRELLRAAMPLKIASRGRVRPFVEPSPVNTVACYFGTNGLRELARSHTFIPRTIWQSIRDQLAREQQPDGSWAPVPAGGAEETFRATAAGLLAFQIADAELRDQAAGPCDGNVVVPQVSIALGWIDRFLARRLPNYWGMNYPCEAAWWTERIGDTFGREYLGGRDWFSEVARTMLTAQQPDGSWGNLSETAYGLMFLTQGNGPLIFSKLAYAPGANNAAWNERPEDVSNAAAWISGQLQQRPGNWQAVSIDAPLADFRRARILYIAGNHALNFNVVQKLTLRKFVEQGGLILGNADGGSEEFARSFHALGKDLFPNSPFRTLPANHVIYRERYRVNPTRVPPKLVGISNGARELMLLAPDIDLSIAWQQNEPESRYMLAANIYLYVRHSGRRNFLLSKAEAIDEARAAAATQPAGKASKP